jgi:hypothetical protein
MLHFHECLKTVFMHNKFKFSIIIETRGNRRNPLKRPSQNENTDDNNNISMLVYCLYDDDSFIGGLSLYYRTYIQCVSSWVGIDYYNFQIKCSFEDLAVHEPKKGE